MDSLVGPLTTAIAYLLSQGSLTPLVSDRIASRHRFAEADAVDGAARGWAAGSAALTLRLDGNDGGFDTTRCAENATDRVRVEARCWGADSADAEQIWVTLLHVCSRHRRGPVILPDARTALLLVLEPLDGPSSEVDPDTGLDNVRGTLRVWTRRAALDEE